MLAIAVVGGGITAAALATGGRAENGVDASAVPQGSIAADTRMGAVELRAADLDGMADYYGPAGIGLDVLERAADVVSLGAHGHELVRLVAAEAAPAAHADAGLFHTAIRFDDAPGLARALVGVASAYPHLYGGASDHAVSHAFYFADPEGNGVELYVDTPRDLWVWEDGEVQMGSAPLDINAFVAEHLGAGTDTGTGSGATVGHVHLKVGDLGQAEAFYSDLLGFAVTARADGAIFLAAGGYHHHLAANTWGSAGAGERPETLGLGSLEVLVPAQADLDVVAARLTDAGAAFDETAGAIVVADPWGTVVELRVAG
ncbi:VOC family protein [Agrococcus carbonis]|uniref:VOC family protein n=1 Tax=Agrococcus carbonis TaxID=684552 RepID=UPI001E363ADA|nr:VOC family protein [Agrococcus carbonis]